jgi:hypothetical protein
VVVYGVNHWLDLANGTAVYLTIEEPNLLTGLRRFGPNLWHIDQMVGPRNASPSFAQRQTLERKLKDAGIRLIEVSPAYAISNLDRAVRSPKIGAPGDDDGLDDMPDDLGVFP